LREPTTNGKLTKEASSPPLAAARYHSPPSKKVFSAFLILRAPDFFF
jgi:hypothetical protein